MLVRAVLSAVLPPQIVRRIERVVEAAFGVLAVMLFLVLGIAFGDLRVVALMLGVIAVVALYVFRERLGISRMGLQAILILLVAGAFVWMRFYLQASPGSE